jgi:hypothetical protein
MIAMLPKISNGPVQQFTPQTQHFTAYSCCLETFPATFQPFTTTIIRNCNL